MGQLREVTMQVKSDEITTLLQRARQGDEAAADALLRAVYGELRRIAAAFMGREAAGHTLQTTALIHEAWLRLEARIGSIGGIARTSTVLRRR